MSAVGSVIRVYRGGCEVVYRDEIVELRLMGRHAHHEVSLAIGDDVSFDPGTATVNDVQPRRTKLARLRSRDGREQVIAANMEQLGIVASVVRPEFRPGAVDRFLIAARAGGLDAILIVNKTDLLEGAPLPDEVLAYDGIVPIYGVSAKQGEGLAELREVLAGLRTVFAGHSGVGKSSLLNALEPELRLETGEVTRKDKGRHTTTTATWLRLPGNAVVVDTPGLREIATGPVDVNILRLVYPDIEMFADECQFRNCRHAQEPGCGVASAVESGKLPLARVWNYQKLIAELSA